MEEPNMDKSVKMREILEDIPSLVTQEQNEILVRPIDMEELEEAVKKLKKDKALSLDGFTTNFFHAWWNTIKEEVLAIVKTPGK